MNNELDRASDADDLSDLYAQTLYVLRESRKAMLKQYAADNEAGLLEKITHGELAEHPAYEHYLSALIIEQMRAQVRAQAARQLSGASEDHGADVSVHLMLKGKIEEHYAHRLSEPVRLTHDALLLSFDTALMVEVRYFSCDEYSIGWVWGEAELRIDTAPVHAACCATFPHHLHDDTAVLRADTRTAPGASSWPNFRRLIDVLLDDPLLEKGSDLK